MAEELDLVSEIIRSNNLRRDDNHQLSIVKGKLQVEDREIGPDYTDMDQAIKMVGEGDEAELKDLLGKAEGIEAPPRISRQNIRNRVFQGLTNVGLDPEKSSFVADLFVGDMDTEFGLLDFMAVMSPVDIIEGIRRFRGGAKLEGSLQTAAGALEAAPYVGKAVKTLKEPIKTAVSSVAGPAREFIEKQGSGTRLGANDAENIIAQGVVALDDTINPKKNNPELRKLELPTDNKPGIIAFHGSGADFDEFKVEKIGTGEGNQAFGYGLYFTESKDIANFYKSSVGAGNEVTYKGKTVRDLDKDNASYEENIAHMVGQQNNAKDRQRVFDNEFSSNIKSLSGIEQAIKDFNTDPDTYPLKFRGLSLTMDDALRIKNDFAERVSSLKELEKNLDTIKTKPKGKVYKVGIAPKESELLDYDKPLGEQNEFIKSRLEKLVQEINLDDAMNYGFDAFVDGEANALRMAREQMLKPENSVLSFLNDWAIFRGEENTAEKLLDKYGIKGIKYKANQGLGARNVPETGKNNYVIFDDKLIKVLEKYGIVGPVALTAVASQQGETDG